MYHVNDNNHTGQSRMRGWTVLLAVLAGLWLFAVWLGPLLEDRIPVFDRIVQTIECQDIDAGAYFYTEIDATYDGERYLKRATQPPESERTSSILLSFSGILICLMLLVLGFRYLPGD